METHFDFRVPVFAGLLLLLMLAARPSYGQQVQINTWPKNVTLMTGDSVSLECDVNGPYPNYFEWRAYPDPNSRPTGVQIYSCSRGSDNSSCMPSPNFPSSKYRQVGKYGLNITGVSWQDGVNYACLFSSAGVEAIASVVVIDKLEALIIVTDAVPKPIQPTVVHFNFSGQSGPSVPSMPSMPSMPSAMTTTPTVGSRAAGLGAANGSTVSSSSSGSTTPTMSNPSSSSGSTTPNSGSTSSTRYTSHNTASSLTGSQSALLSCTVQFGSTNYFNSDQQGRIPRLRMNFGGTEIYANATVGLSSGPVAKYDYVPGVPGVSESSMTMSVTYPMTTSDVGKVLTCTVSTSNPQFTTSVSKKYTLAASDWWIDIEPQHDVYYLDDVIICSAPAHPNAVVHWYYKTGPMPMSPIYTGDLHLNASGMAGENVFICRVYEYESIQTVMNETTFEFNLTATHRNGNNEGQSNDDDEAKRRIGLGVGLGLGLGLLAIIIIVLVIFFMRRRNRSSGVTKPKAGDKPAPTSSAGYSALNASGEVDPVPPPIYQPRANAAAPPHRGSPNPSNEPSLNTSLNQSGHGDLGGPGFHATSLPSRTSSIASGAPSANGASEKPLISLGTGPVQPQQQQPVGLAGSGIPGRTGIPYMDHSRDSASVASGPLNASIVSSASSMAQPSGALGPNITYQPRGSAAFGGGGGHATGV